LLDREQWLDETRRYESAQGKRTAAYCTLG